jgi:preprotein translocase subunit Sec63
LVCLYDMAIMVSMDQLYNTLQMLKVDHWFINTLSSSDIFTIGGSSSCIDKNLCAYVGQKSPVSVNLAATPEMAARVGRLMFTGMRPVGAD